MLGDCLAKSQRSAKKDKDSIRYRTDCDDEKDMLAE